MANLLLKLCDDGELITLGTLAEGDQGTDQTASAIRAIVQAYASHPMVRGCASMFQGPTDLYEWLRRRVHFSADPKGVELVRTPTTLLGQMSRTSRAKGDCDDMACLGATLLAAMGKTPVLAVVGPTPRELDGRFVHILFGYMDPSAPRGVVLMDPQEGFPPGQVPNFTRARIYWADGEHAP